MQTERKIFVSFDAHMVQGTKTCQKAVQTTPQEHIQNRTAEQTMDILMPGLIEKIGDIVQSIAQERVQNRTAERTVAMSDHVLLVAVCGLCREGEGEGGVSSPSIAWCLIGQRMVDLPPAKPLLAASSSPINTGRCSTSLPQPIRSLLLAQLDTSKVFDNFCHSAILAALERIQSGSQLKAFAANMLKQSNVCLSLGNIRTEQVRLDRGVSQGAPESPFLFFS